MTKIENAQITGTMLGVEDHGILTSFLYLEYSSGGSQGFGGYVLGDTFAAEWIEGVLHAVGVDDWEHLKGKYVRVKYEGDSSFERKVKAIGHITKEKWFDIEQATEKYREKK